MLKLKVLRMYICFVWAILMAHSSASACSDLNGDGVVNVADFLIFVNDFGKTVSCDHVSKVQLVIQNQFNDAVWDTSRNAAGVLTITITKKLPPPPPPPPPVTTPVNTDDRTVLVEFYNAMGAKIGSGEGIGSVIGERERIPSRHNIIRFPNRFQAAICNFIFKLMLTNNFP